MARELIPALLCDDQETMAAKLVALQGLVDWAQVDVLDGTLYANQSWYEASFFQTQSLSFSLELHLMVNDPETIIESWKDVPSFKRAIWHIEAPIDHEALIKRVHGMGLEVGLALAPSTPIDRLTPYLHDIERVLVLGVEPGWSGQPLVPGALDTVRTLSRQDSHQVIAFDGGVSDATLPQILEAGVEAVCAASLLFNHPPLDQRIREIRAKLA